jgi:hypothetical protein
MATSFTERKLISERKARLIHHRADRRAPTVRSFGCITLAGPCWVRPIVLRGAAFTVIIDEEKEEDLRNARIWIESQFGQWSTVTLVFYLVLGCTLFFFLGRSGLLG